MMSVSSDTCRVGGARSGEVSVDMVDESVHDMWYTACEPKVR